MAINSYKLHKDDAKDLENELIKMLSNSKSGVIRDVDDYVRGNDYNNQDFDDLLQNVFIVGAYFDEVAYVNNDKSDLQTDFKAAAATASKLAIGDFVYNNKELIDPLSDSEYDTVVKLSDKFATAYDVIVNGKEVKKERSRRDDRRDSRRDSRRDGRRDDRDRDTRRDDRRRDSRRDDRRDDRDRDSRRDDNKPDIEYATANKPAKAEPERRERRREEREPREEAVVHPVTVDVRNSDLSPVIDPGSFKAVAFSPETHNAVHHVKDGRATLAVTERDENMEPYEMHELGASPFNKTDGLHVPTVDLRQIPSVVASEDIGTANNSTLNTPLVISHGGLRFDPATYHHALSSANAFTYTDVTNSVNIVIPKEVAELLEHSSTIRTFEGWNALLNKIVATCDAANNTGAVSNIVTILNRRLTSLVNDLLAVVLDTGATLSDFSRDLNDALGYLRTPERTSAYSQWTLSEAQLLKANMAVAVTYREDDEMLADIVITEKVLHVKILGEFPLDKVQITANEQLAEINFSEVPEFYMACDRVATLRNAVHAGSSIVLSDSYHNVYTIVAGLGGQSRIRARKYM